MKSWATRRRHGTCSLRSWTSWWRGTALARSCSRDRSFLTFLTHSSGCVWGAEQCGEGMERVPWEAGLPDEEEQHRHGPAAGTDLSSALQALHRQVSQLKCKRIDNENLVAHDETCNKCQLPIQYSFLTILYSTVIRKVWYICRTKEENYARVPTVHSTL